MNKTLRTTLIVLAVLIGAAALVWTGFSFGRATAWGMGGFYPGGMMSYFDQNDQDARYGYGMMGGYGYGGMMGGMGPGRMRGYGSYGDVEPLSVEEAREAVASYLVSFGNDDLAIEEIMIFDNNAYAIIVEESTGIGAFELLVDPVTKAVFPEYGPNMMWNLKYGMHAGGFRGMMSGSYGGMMGGFGYGGTAEIPEVSAELSVSPEEALEAAQNFLDQYYPGVKVSDEITAFYGYYTIDTQKDGEIVGMLSVNGYSGQVFPHTWHGDFIEMVHDLDHE